MDIKVLFDFDELNRIWMSTQQSEYDMEKILESAYILGAHRTAEQLGYEDEIDDLIDMRLLQDAVFQKIEGKTFADRMNDEGLNSEEPTGEGDIDTGEISSNMKRLLETEYHRVVNKGSADTAEKISGIDARPMYKTWRTMRDDRVRDTHDYMEGMKVRMGDEFYTYNGDHAIAPAQFGIPDEDINCRCYLDYSFGDESDNNGEDSV